MFKRILAIIITGVALLVTAVSVSSPASASVNPSGGMQPGQYRIVTPPTKDDPNGVLEFLPDATPIVTTNGATNCTSEPVSSPRAVKARCQSGNGSVSAVGQFYDAQRNSWYPAGSGTNKNLVAYGPKQPVGVYSWVYPPSNSYTVKYNAWAAW